MPKEHKIRERVIQSPYNQEQEMISLAIEQARYQLENKIAPASTVNYYLKLAGRTAEVESRIKESQIKVLEAKAAKLDDSRGEKSAYEEVIESIKSYQYDGLVS